MDEKEYLFDLYAVELDCLCSLNGTGMLSAAARDLVEHRLARVRKDIRSSPVHTSELQCDFLRECILEISVQNCEKCRFNSENILSNEDDRDYLPYMPELTREQTDRINMDFAQHANGMNSLSYCARDREKDYSCDGLLCPQYVGLRDSYVAMRDAARTRLREIGGRLWNL